MTRTPAKADGLRAAGALPVVADALDRDAMIGAVLGAEPEVIVHQMTALTGATDLGTSIGLRDDQPLRTEGTRHLLDAARAAGTRRLHRPELHRLAVRPRRRPGQGRGRAAGSRAAARAAASRWPRSASWRRWSPGPRRRRGRRAALRRLLRPGHEPGTRRRADRPRAPAPPAGRRRRRGRCRRSPTSTTRPAACWRPWRPAARPASSRSSTTSRRAPPTGSRRWPTALGAPRPATSRAGSAASRRARSR